MSGENISREKRRRGAVFLPNIVTTASMFFGFYSIQQSILGNFIYASWALLISAVLDALDGRIARLVRGTSEFGEEYDSLADLVSFGLAPAILAIRWALGGHFGELGWAVGFIYLAGAAIRLARFNILIGSEQSKSYFQGMPSPCAAGLPVTPVMVYTRYLGNGPLEFYPWAIAYLVAVAGAGILMVSPIRFRTFKDIKFTRYGIHLPLFGFAVIMSLLFLFPQPTLFGATFAYISWAFLEEFLILRPKERELRRKRREERRKRRQERKLQRQKERQARMKVVSGQGEKEDE